MALVGHPLAFLGSLSFGEMVIIGLVALLVFGKRLPEVARSLGKGVSEFRRGLSGLEDELRRADQPSLAPPPAPPVAAPAVSARDARVERPQPAPPQSPA